MTRFVEENAALVFSIITSIVFCSAAFGVAQQQISENKSRSVEWQEDHDLLLGVAADVKWIRARLARDERVRLSSQFHKPQEQSRP